MGLSQLWYVESTSTIKEQKMHANYLLLKVYYNPVPIVLENNVTL